MQMYFFDRENSRISQKTLFWSRLEQDLHLLLELELTIAVVRVLVNDMPRLASFSIFLSIFANRVGKWVRHAVQTLEQPILGHILWERKRWAIHVWRTGYTFQLFMRNPNVQSDLTKIGTISNHATSSVLEMVSKMMLNPQNVIFLHKTDHTFEWCKIHMLISVFKTPVGGLLLAWSDRYMWRAKGRFAHMSNSPPCVSFMISACCLLFGLPRDYSQSTSSSVLYTKTSTTSTCDMYPVLN